jgi:hypothetical protein
MLYAYFVKYSGMLLCFQQENTVLRKVYFYIAAYVTNSEDPKFSQSDSRMLNKSYRYIKQYKMYNTKLHSALN